MSIKLIESQSKKKANYRNRPKKTVNFRNLQKLSKKLKKQGKKIVFTTGSFDLLNPGQCRFLAEAKSKGDILVAGVASNWSDKKLRGQEYPLVDEETRMELLSHLRTVDYVLSVDEDNPHGVLILLKPDIYFTDAEKWGKGMRDSQEKYIVNSYGGKIIKRKVQLPYINTSMLADHIANIRVIQILENYLRDKVENFLIDPVKDLKPADFGKQKPWGRGAFDPQVLGADFADLGKLYEKYRRQKKKIVFVGGSFDLLHVGHARFVEKAGVLGDILVVGIPSDRSLKKLKGVGRPVISEKSRAYLITHLDYVNHVVIFDGSTVLGALENLKPDVFFTVSEGWNLGYKKSPEYRLVKGYGGKVVAAKRQAPYISASAIIDKMAAKKVREIFSECMKEEVYKKVVGE